MALADSPAADGSEHSIEVPRTNLTQYSLDAVVAAELEEIVKRREENRRRKALLEPQAGDVPPPPTRQTPENVRNELVGLALSGGGIRSGAFSLGVLAALTKSGVMNAIDYLSTVSGGGYAGAYWSTRALNSDLATSKKTHEEFVKEHDVAIDERGTASKRLLKFIHSGNYLNQTINFLNRYIPGLVLIAMMAVSGLIAGASGLAWLFREIDRPGISDAVAALGFDGDVRRSFFPTACCFVIWSLAWLGSYVKFGQRGRGIVAGVLFWPLMVSVLASIGSLLATGDIGFPTVESILGASGTARTVPHSLWYVLYSVVGASLLPYLRLPLLIRSGLAPSNVTEKYLFRIASVALLLGVPFVAFTWMAQENISGHLESRSPEVAEADLFGGLMPNERQVVFGVMRAFGEMDERAEFGEIDLRGELKKLRDTKQLKLSDDQASSLLHLATKFVFEPSMETKSLERKLSELQIDAKPESLNQIRQWMLKARNSMLDWPKVESRLMLKLSDVWPDQWSTEPSRVEVCEFTEFKNLVRKFLTDEISKKDDLEEAICELLPVEKMTAKARFSNEIESLFPPPIKRTPRQKTLEEALQGILRDARPAKHAAIQQGAWKYATIHDYYAHDLERDLMAVEAQSNQFRVTEITRNFWPPRHELLVDQWERLFSRQAVLELPQPETALSRERFVGAAVANERMSVPQRLRFFVSFVFHWGITPLVEEEGSGITHNPLYRIWSVRQHRREVETEIVNRLNGQILANPDFVIRLARIVKPGSIETDTGVSLLSSLTSSATKSEIDRAVDRFPETLRRPARFAAEASVASQQRFDHQTASAVELNELEKDDDDHPETLTSQRAVLAVQHEQRRQDLVAANRQLLEAYIQEQTKRNERKSVAEGCDASAGARAVSLHSAGRIFGRTVWEPDQAFREWVFWRAALLFVFLLFIIDLNSTSLHGFYRMAIASNWIEPVPGAGREVTLAQLDTTSCGQPYHLISASLNLMGRREKNAGDNRPDHFLFSRLFCGSTATGYVKTREFAGGDYKLADAISVSGAAVSPAQNTGILIRTLLFLGNLRLGQWVANPGFRSWNWTPHWVQDFRYWCYFTAGRLVSQKWQVAEKRPYVFLTDGGHNENLGISPLLKRRCRIILAFDAGADETYQFADLANLSRWAELTHGVTFTPLSFEEIKQLIPDRSFEGSLNQKETVPRLAQEHWIAARINYPPKGDSQEFAGLLIYLKSNLTGREPFEVVQFARDHKQFPHDTTVDQCYDSDQFAAYVRLGHHIAQGICAEIKDETSVRWLAPLNQNRELHDAIRQLILKLSEASSSVREDPDVLQANSASHEMRADTMSAPANQANAAEATLSEVSQPTADAPQVQIQELAPPQARQSDSTVALDRPQSPKRRARRKSARLKGQLPKRRRRKKT